MFFSCELVTHTKNTITDIAILWIDCNQTKLGCA